MSGEGHLVMVCDRNTARESPARRENMRQRTTGWKSDCPKQTVLQALIELRLRDGEALLKMGVPERRSGALYVAGYGLECALKARICADRGETHLDRQLHHHDLRRLAEATGLWPVIKRDNARLRRLVYFQTMWDVRMRYAKRPHGEAEVREFLSPARDFTKWLSEH